MLGKPHYGLGNSNIFFFFFFFWYLPLHFFSTLLDWSHSYWLLYKLQALLQSISRALNEPAKRCNFHHQFSSWESWESRLGSTEDPWWQHHSLLEDNTYLPFKSSRTKQEAMPSSQVLSEWKGKEMGNNQRRTIGWQLHLLYSGGLVS